MVVGRYTALYEGRNLLTGLTSLRVPGSSPLRTVKNNPTLHLSFFMV